MTAYHADREQGDFPSCPGEPRLGDLIELEDVFTVAAPCATPPAPDDPEAPVPVIVPVDTDDDGTHDTCVDLLITSGIEPCGLSEFAVEGGEPIPLYCGTPRAIEAECSPGQFPFDSNDDGIADTCVGPGPGPESPAGPNIEPEADLPSDAGQLTEPDAEF